MQDAAVRGEAPAENEPGRLPRASKTITKGDRLTKVASLDGQGLAIRTERAAAPCRRLTGSASLRAAAGIRYPGRTDLLLALFEPGTSVAGVLTRSKTASAPVEWCRARLQHGMARVLVVNSGNANAFTGKRGREAVKLTAEAAAQAADCLEADVYLASTGVIGEPLDPGKIHWPLGRACRDCRPGRDRRCCARDHDHRHLSQARHAAGRDRGRARHHQRHRQGRRHDRAGHGDHARFPLHRRGDRARAVARARSPQPWMPPSTPSPSTATPRRATRCLLFATGTRGRARRAAHRARARSAAGELQRGAHRGAARSGAPGGEGRGGGDEVRHGAGDWRRDARAARRIALSIANSPLVKTAIAGEDPNWGRIVMAVGKAGEAADRDRLAIWLRRHPGRQGGRGGAVLSRGAWRRLHEAREIAITVDVGVGEASRDRVDLRSHRRLHRHQCRLPVLTGRWKAATPPLLLVAACVLLDSEGAILIAKRPPGRSLAGLWEFPGGKVEQGESPEHALDPRACRGARHRHRPRRSRAPHLREPRLSRLSPA